MSETDRDALAEVARVITATLKGWRWAEMTPRDIATAILASDWLAQVKATAQADALREAVEQYAITIPDVLGYKVRAVAVEDMLDRVDAIDGGAR
jgi:hypothetical protein